MPAVKFKEGEHPSRIDGGSPLENRGFSASLKSAGLEVKNGGVGYEAWTG